MQNADHAIVVRADARAMGAITALRVGGTRPMPRTNGPASECISYFAADKSDAVVFHATRTRKPNRVPSRYSLDNRPHRITAADLPAIGDQNH